MSRLYSNNNISPGTPKPIITKRRSERQSLSESIPPARFVFVPNPVWTSQIRHLTYHIWPTKKHDGWKWNCEQLAQRWSLFNGTRVLGIVTSKDAWEPQIVLEFCRSLGMTFDHVVVKPNSPKLREVVTWLPMLKLLNPEAATHNEVVFSAHAKGVRHAGLSDTLEAWAKTMYTECLDDWPAVEEHLSKYLATGCFKRYNNFKTPGNDCWHYSGTFFWWRLAELAKRNWKRVDQRFFGTESWPGLLCKREETGCLFVDGVLNLYDHPYMHGVVLPEWMTKRKPVLQATDNAETIHAVAVVAALDMPLTKVGGMKLEIGGGNRNRGPGWVNLDQCETADIRHDLNVIPWPIADDSADEIYSSHCIEHVIDPHAFLRECARIGKIGCQVEIRCPAPFADLAMTAGHIHVFSPQQVRNMEYHFPQITWGTAALKRPKLIGYRQQPTERLREARAELPFLNGVSDAVVMKYIPGTAHDTVYSFIIQKNEYAS